MQTTLMTLGQRIFQSRKAKKLTQRKLAALLGVSREAVSQWESGESNPKSATMRKAAVILDVGFDWLATGRTEVGSPVEGLPLKGEIAGGVWYEIPETQDMEYRRVPVAPDPKYPAEAQLAFQIRGNSVNRIAGDGTIVICVDIMASGIEPRPGDLVWVERRKGSLVEATIKRLRRGAGGLELWPESDDPNHQEKLSVRPAKGEAEVVIRGIVIYTLNPVMRGD